MSQNTYARTRKIQIQDVKGSVKGLFPEDDKAINAHDLPPKKGGFLTSLFKVKNRTGLNDRRKGVSHHAPLDATTITTKTIESFKKLSDTTQKMYHSDGNFTSITKFLRSLSDHISSGRTVHAIQHSLHKNIYDKKFEKLLFKSSEPQITTENLTITTDYKEFGLGIKPVPSNLLKTILSNLPDRLNHFHFLDIGSGAGRALLIASCFPFKKVNGVEYAKELHEISRSNLSHFPRSLMKCRDVNCTLAEATTTQIPQSNTVFLFHAPFKMKVYQDMIDKITQSYKEKPRRFYLIFIETPDNARLDRIIERSHIYERFEIPALQRWYYSWLNPFNVVIYRTVFQERT